MTNNPYTVLGVSESATQDEIKTAYRKKAKENHPDLHPDDPLASEKMNEINEAYATLTDPQKLAQWKASQQDPFVNMYGAPGAGPQANPYAQYNPYGQNPFGNFTSDGNGRYYTKDGRTFYYYSTGSRPQDNGSGRRSGLFGRVVRTVLFYAAISFFFRMIFRGGFFFFPFFFF